MPLERRQTPPVPPRPDLYPMVTTRGGDPLPVPTPRHGVDGIRMPLKRRQTPPLLPRPDLHRFIPARGGDPLPVPAPRHAEDGIRMPLERRHTPPRPHRPHGHPTIGAPHSQPLPVRTPRHRVLSTISLGAIQSQAIPLQPLRRHIAPRRLRHHPTLIIFRVRHSPPPRSSRFRRPTPNHHRP